jgi:hypothetical protein
MATIISPDDLREHVESGLGDAALQRLIDDADAAIVARYGPHDATEAAPVSEEFTGGDLRLFPRQKVASVVSVTEYVGSLGSAEVSYELDPDDWRLEHAGGSIVRLASGPTPAGSWGSRIVIEYLPQTDYSRRQRVALDLCRLAAQQSGLASERAGDYAATSVEDYQRERERILNELAPMGGMVIA